MQNTRRSRWIAASSMVAVLIFGAGCSETGLPTLEPTTAPSVVETAPASGTSGSGGSVKPATLADARKKLAALKTKTIPGKDSTYERDAYGDAWSDAAKGVQFGGNGCDTRNDILRRDAVPGTIRTKNGTTGCKVTAGTWVSQYNGARYTDKSKIQIDHIVPLARAWASGAKRWSATRRLAFANDPDNLIAVDGTSNQKKSDKGPSAWRPAQPYQCAYAVRYIRSASKYALPITTTDKTALTSMLKGCNK